MKLIIPMAGRGTRLRPHSLTTPKPLLPVAGPILIERIIQSFIESLDSELTEIGFVLGDFGQEVEVRLAKMTRDFGANPAFYYQNQALGTAHAVHCAAGSLAGEVIVAFADTLFEVGGRINLEEADSVIWLKKVANPSSYGVAVIDDGRITRFIEKPKEPISDMAIIGVYYFRDGERLKNELAYLMENDIRGHKNEFDLTDAIDRLLKQGAVFKAADVDQWLDFGTIPAWISSTKAVLNRMPNREADAGRFPGSQIIPPCYIGRDVRIENSTVGPYACIGNGCTIKKSQIRESIIREDAVIVDSKLDHSTIGIAVNVDSCEHEIHVGDHSRVGGSLKSAE